MPVTLCTGTRVGVLCVWYVQTVRCTWALYISRVCPSYVHTRTGVTRALYTHCPRVHVHFMSMDIYRCACAHVCVGV